MIPIEEQEINQKNRQEEHPEMNQVKMEEQLLNYFEYAGITEKGDPHTAKEAMSTPEAHEWKEAMQSEYKALMKNNTWILVDRSKNRKVIGSRWVPRTKFMADGSVERRKARIVAKGFSQEPNVDFHETFAPVARTSSVRIVMGLAAELGLEIHQLDFISAYLNGNVEEEIYMELPEGLSAVLEEKQYGKLFENKVCLLKRAIYGLKQSGHQWYKKLDLRLRELKFKPLGADACVYMREENGKLTLVVIYVDDLIIASNNKKMSKLKENLAKSFEMKDLGQLHYCLGIEFSQDKTKNEIRMTQRKYIQDVLRRFNMTDCKPADTPMNPALKLSKQVSPTTEENKKQMSQIPYRNLVGSLMYLATSTRPDIAHAISALSQFNENPGQGHWKAAKRVLRYLKKTENLGITFTKTGEKLNGFSDADWGANIDDRRSYTGYIFKLAGGAINWSSRKQKTVAMSSAEAEYMALSEAAKETIYIRRFLSEVIGELDVTTIFCDNQSAGLMAKNPVFHERTKHIDLRYHFVREAVEDGKIKIGYLPTEDMPAYVLTKGLSMPKHEKCINDIGLKN